MSDKQADGVSPDAEARALCGAARLAASLPANVFVLRDNIHTLAEHVERLLARVAELESLTVPGRFYRCGCPARRSSKVMLFCSQHHKMIVDADATPA